MKAEDKILLQELNSRNHKVFESLYKAYYPELVSFAIHYTGNVQSSEDIVQDFFIYIWNNAGQLNITTSLKAYFYTAIKNRCFNYLRNLKVQDKYNLVYIDYFWNRINEDVSDDTYIIEEMMRALDQLTPELSELFSLKYQEGKKINEIAGEQKISENTIKKRLLKAKKILKDKLAHLKGILISL